MPQANQLTGDRLAAMIEEATVDAYGESEELTGWFTMIEDSLAVPFETTVLGVGSQSISGKSCRGKSLELGSGGIGDSPSSVCHRRPYWSGI